MANNVRWLPYRIQYIGIGCSHIFITITLGQMVLKGVNRVHYGKIRLNGLERSQLGYTMQRSGYMVLKGVNCIHNEKKDVYPLILSLD